MGIIDVHTHLTNRSEIHEERNVPFLEMGGHKLQNEFPIRHLLQEMDEADIEMSVVLGSPATSGIETDYKALSIAIDPHRDRLLPFVCLDPFREDDPASLVRHFVEDLGYRGVGEWGYFDFTDPRCDPVYQACIDLDIPILIHTGVTLPTTSLRWGWPVLVDEVAIKFPELRIIAAHCGAPWWNELLTVALRQPNVYVDISAMAAFPLIARYQAIFTMIAGGLSDRLLFGSDYPVTSPSQWARWVRSLRLPWPIGKLLDIPPFGKQEKQALFEDNARRFLKL